MQPTLCDECGRPITSRARLEAGISFCSEACEFEDERKSCERLGLQPSLQLDRYDEMLANVDPADLLCEHGKSLGGCLCDYDETDEEETDESSAFPAVNREVLRY